MPRSYADLSSLVSNKLADTAVSTFPAADVNYQIEESLKELSGHFPHTIEVIFNLESRQGVASTTSASNLVDTTKGQFISSDPTNEKVVWNYTRKTWATITSFSTTAQVGLSSDIMQVNDTYYIYNKRCRNQKQVFIADYIEIMKPVRAEYYTHQWPREWRNVRWEHGSEVLELDIDFSPDDSNSNTAIAGIGKRTEVVVEFEKPHVLNQLTDWSATLSATAAAAATSLALTALQSAGTIEEGDEFHLEDQRSLYIITADATIASSAVTISFLPPLEAAATSTDLAVTFVKSSLKPQHEEILANLVAGRLATNKSIKFANTINIGGGEVWRNYLTLGRSKEEEALAAIRREKRWKTYLRNPTE